MSAQHEMATSAANITADDREHAVRWVLRDWHPGALEWAVAWCRGDGPAPRLSKKVHQEIERAAHAFCVYRLVTSAREKKEAPRSSPDERELELLRTRRELGRLREDLRKLGLVYRRTHTAAHNAARYLDNHGLQEAGAVRSILDKIEEDEPLTVRAACG